jgi:hypothetical protein
MVRPDAELATLFRHSRHMAARLYHFNYEPAAYLHPTRRGLFTRALASDTVWTHPRARAALSVHILDTLGADGRPCFDLAREEWTWLLLDAERLDRLARHTGATLYRKAIVRCIRHEEVDAWKRVLGPDACKFALHGAALLPDFGLPDCAGGPPAALATAHGWLEAALSEAPGPMSARGRLKLPLTSMDAPADGACARRLVSSLLLILEPSWRSSFAEIRK